MLLYNAVIITVLSEIDSPCPLPSSSAAIQHLNIHLQDHHQFVISLKFLKFYLHILQILSEPIFKYILQYLNLDVRSVSSTKFMVLHYKLCICVKSE